jgi:hypothetical protein
MGTFDFVSWDAGTWQAENVDASFAAETSHRISGLCELDLGKVLLVR